MKDPYETLGVPRNASDEDIKKAYRDLARKYHPDNYVNHPLADLVEEKMKEVNEAYDTIQKERARGNPSSSGGGQSYGQNYGGYSQTNASYARIRTLINEKRFSEAEIMLDAVAHVERNAEWNFLKGCVLIQRGRYYDALRYVETACYMDPNNQEYQSARSALKNSTASYGGRDEACDICTSLLCANLLCSCCR
ncbi:MAG: DnaJ domain-containing protein [Clostridia bacterium]|nr:DnaJ domain-containing protein [Clostridia bacterium]